jgi:hypothetical protein
MTEERLHLTIGMGKASTACGYADGQKSRPSVYALDRPPARRAIGVAKLSA